MIEADKILEGVELEPGLEGVSRPYSPSLGFAYTQSTCGPNGYFMSMIGFSGDRQASFVVPESDGDIRSATHFDDLLSDERTIKMQARGIGTRMYNTPQACLGTGEGYQINAYAFDIDVDKIVDRRHFNDYRGRMGQLFRQLGRVAQARVMGLEPTIDSIHESFGEPEDVDAVLYNQSLTMERQQVKVGIEQTSGIHPAFMVIRNPQIVMHKIGEYRQ